MGSVEQNVGTHRLVVQERKDTKLISTTTEECNGSVERIHRSTCNKMGTTTSWCGATTTSILVTTLDTHGTWNETINFAGGNRRKDEGS